MAERQLTFAGHVVHGKRERAVQREDLSLYVDFHVASGALPHRGPRVMAASTVLEGPDRRSAVRRPHLVASQALHRLVLHVAKYAYRVRRSGGRLWSGRAGLGR